jgi:O-antigen/teichoic acid export membrane protein
MTQTKSRRRSNGAGEIIVATAIGGGSGYVLTVIAGIALGARGYAMFAVFWSALYLVISAISGIQQEVARATNGAMNRENRRPVARNFAVAAALAIAIVALGTSPLWSPHVFPGAGWELVIPLALGLSSYVVVAVLAGVLYGIQMWRFIAAMIMVDGLTRLVLVGGMLFFTHELAVVVWGVIVPFISTPVIVWFFIRSRVVSLFVLDVGYRALTWNVARTVTGAAATGVLISGFPLLLGATSINDAQSDVAALIFATNLTRAPIVIVVLALQSYLVIYFRSHLDKFWRHLAAIVAGIVVVTALVTALVGWLGPWALDTFFGSDYALNSGVLIALVSSAGAVAALCATGPVVLALGRHSYYTMGWVVAAFGTIVALLLPLGLTERTILALWIGPVAGLAVHAFGLAFGSSPMGRNSTLAL